ncbi:MULTISPECIES: carboxymuconolactone decarboxylase family protein [Stappia]|uniref:4-carboxymuconolactone decarboxylase n=1 Tax=Stappia indica TaxID=538381 RepID=A0A285TTJ0_9HYPH|nr:MULTISPECIES: carboxymuconolactone decarboxylase family protein [Stappia]MCC4243848.1 carboxymuconolactone decarboxylase family protein [Stappia indica]SOC27084.1 4-carboxymuconolactone decarboxylase [Stappia indica]
MTTKTMRPDGTPAGERFEAGLKTRREVLGDAYVNASVNKATDYNWPMQQLVTEYCWGDVWNREGLGRRERSILNLGMISALGRSHELRLHVRGAINNGLTKEEIREIMLQVAIYCGVPAGIDSFRTAQEVFEEMGI